MFFDAKLGKIHIGELGSFFLTCSVFCGVLDGQRLKFVMVAH